MTRRRRFFRDDVVAPWLILGVILGVWWLGASALGPITAAREPATSVIRPRRDAGGGEPTVTDRAMASPEESKNVPYTAVGGDVGELLDKGLVVPVAGMAASSLRSTFQELRSGGRTHKAMDILAPRGTPVVAVGDGRLVKLFTSAQGGLTIYQFDREERFCYYYAHLDSYAANLNEGQEATRGQIIGYVGTTGNAPPGAPHLHFAIFKIGAEKKWWDGVPIDPFLVIK